jgi:hypothetical protein
MGAGIMQLVAHSIQDSYIVDKSQITFFKSVFKHHTLFSTEAIMQKFVSTPNFGKKVSCVIAKYGDLIKGMTLVVSLPAINSQTDNNIGRIAWLPQLGYRLIKSIEIEIGEQTIEKQYGEWMHIWNELTNTKNDGMNKMIGNSGTTTLLSTNKQAMTVYVPLKFWFCKHIGLSLPITALKYQNVKVTVEFNDIDKCLLKTPTHYISVYSDLVNYEIGETIVQIVNNETHIGIFEYFDILTKRLYYKRISENPFVTFSGDDTFFDPTASPQNPEYLITGISTNFASMPKFNTTESSYKFNVTKQINFSDAYILVDYVYVDTDERCKILSCVSEQLIEQVNICSKQIIESTNRYVRLDIKHPVKLLVFVAHMLSQQDEYNYDAGIGETNLIEKAALILNGTERVTFRSIDYYNAIQTYEFMKDHDNGINMYSFSIYPFLFQPSGSINMSKIEQVDLQVKMNGIVNNDNKAEIRVYYIAYNVLKIINGIAQLQFC